jgi:hypothetical protein
MKEVVHAHAIDMNQIRCKHPFEKGDLLPRLYYVLDTPVIQVVFERKAVDWNSAIQGLIWQFRICLWGNDGVIVPSLPQGGKQFSGKNFDSSNVRPKI